MRWKIADAKQRFSEVVRAASREPQLILNRDRPVAALVDARTFAEFEGWREAAGRASLADAFRELRRVCSEERYGLRLASRRDRRNAFLARLAR